MPPNLSAGDWFFGKVLRMGANWQTTLSGIGAALFMALTFLAGASYQLGDIATVIPPRVKGWLMGASLVATVILKIWNAMAQKSKNVTGGNVAQTPNGDIAKKL
jgi:hypothetical protein